MQCFFRFFAGRPFRPQCPVQILDIFCRQDYSWPSQVCGCVYLCFPYRLRHVKIAVICPRMRIQLSRGVTKQSQPSRVEPCLSDNEHTTFNYQRLEQDGSPNCMLKFSVSSPFIHCLTPFRSVAFPQSVSISAPKCMPPVLALLLCSLAEQLAQCTGTWPRTICRNKIHGSRLDYPKVNVTTTFANSISQNKMPTRADRTTLNCHQSFAGHSSTPILFLW